MGSHPEPPIQSINEWVAGKADRAFDPRPFGERVYSRALKETVPAE